MASLGSSTSRCSLGKCNNGPRKSRDKYLYNVWTFRSLTSQGGCPFKKVEVAKVSSHNALGDSSFEKADDSKASSHKGTKLWG